MLHDLICSAEVSCQRRIVGYACEEDEPLCIQIAGVSLREYRLRRIICYGREEKVLLPSVLSCAGALGGIIAMKAEGFCPHSFLPSVHIPRTLGNYDDVRTYSKFLESSCIFQFCFFSSFHFSFRSPFFPSSFLRQFRGAFYYVVIITHVRQGMYVSCIEEIAYRRGFIDRDQLLALAEPLLKTAYGQYLVDIANGL